MYVVIKAEVFDEEAECVVISAKARKWIEKAGYVLRSHAPMMAVHDRIAQDLEEDNA